MQLPAISRIDFLEYLDFQFEATGKPADEDALNYLLNATRAHPRSTQQLAWECWADTPAGQRGDARDRDRRARPARADDRALRVRVGAERPDERRRGRGQRGSRAAAARRSRRRERHQPADRDALRVLQPLARAPGARARCRDAGSSISATAPGTSSIRSSASGCGGPRRSPTCRRRLQRSEL